MKRFLKKQNLFIIIVIFQVVLSFFFDKLIFENQGNSVIPYDQFWFYLTKIVLLIALFYFWKSVFYKKIKNYKFILIYFIIMLLFFFLTYPGVWRWDEMFSLGSVTSGTLYFWQHWLSSFYYYFCLNIIPIPSGIVFIQIIIISIIVGHVIGKCYHKFGKKSLFLYLILLMPSFIDSNLYPIRANICAYIELYIVFELLFLQNKDLKKSKIFLILILSSLLSAWRPENFIYMFFIPIIFIFIFKISIKKIVIPFISGVIIMLMIMFAQSSGLDKKDRILSNGNKISEKELYSLSGFITPFGELVKSEYKNNSNSEILKDINKSISVTKINELGGLGVFWGTGLKSVTSSQLNMLKKSYLKLIVKHKYEFINERFNNFIQANGFVDNTETLLKASAHIYDLKDTGLPADVYNVYNEFAQRYLLNKPLNTNLRKYTVSFLEMKSVKNYNTGNTTLLCIFYNSVWSVLLTIIVLIKSLIKKNWKMVLLIIALAAKFCIIFLTAPMPAYMYYFSTHLICTFIVVYCFLNRKKLNKNNN